MSKEIEFGSIVRAKIKAGVDKAANAVSPTLGVVGKAAIIEWPGLDPIEADDGVTILKNLEFKDKYEQLGLQKLRKAALRTSTEGGDGTATTTVLTQALIKEAFKEINSDSSNIREVRERLETGLIETLSKLGDLKREVSTADIERIATISSLDPEIATVISEMIQEVGINGIITIEKGSQLGYSKEIVKGAKIQSGLISPYFINEPETQSCVLEDVYIVLVDRKISTNEQIISLLGSIGTGSSILFIADGVDSIALASLVANAQNRIVNIACISNPYSASRARDFLFDIASLTGGKVISEEAGMKLNEATKELCGRADRVVVTRESCIIVGGRGKDSLNLRVMAIQGEIQNTTSEYEKKVLEERLAQLSGGIGVIRVGAYTDTEYNTKKYKFENAVNATQAALQEGIVIGGGMALLNVSNVVQDKIFQKALKVPIEQMAINAGMEGYGSFSDPEQGTDFKTKEVGVNMFEKGIIDPFKVVRLALESAVAITKSLVNIDVAIVNEEIKKDE